MDIETVKEKKYKLEQDILNLLLQFSEETDTHVTYVRVLVAPASELGSSIKKYVTIGVTCEVEL